MKWLSRLLGNSSKPQTKVVEDAASNATPPPSGPSRRWDPAQTRPSQQTPFTFGYGQSINTDLAEKLNYLMARTSFECARNPIYEGVVNTFSQDVVGQHGPGLQITSDDPEFNSAVEEAWRKVFALPNPVRKTSGGVESMKQWVRMLLNAGSFINIKTTPRRSDGVNFGWKTIHPRRMVTPSKFAGDKNVAFGQRFNDDGEVIEHYFNKPTSVDGRYLDNDFETIPADVVQHRYFEIEPEQLTGFPVLSTTLDTAAEIRTLDNAEIKAQRINAQNAMIMEANNPDAIVDYDPIKTPTYGVSQEEGEATVLPPGYTAKAIDSNRPSGEHVTYRRERIAELGLPIGMPLLVIMLTVDAANFSSAQFGGMLYAESIRHYQSFLERMTLNELLEEVILELVLTGKVKRPKKYEKVWTHHVPPNANIEKFVKSIRTMVEDGLIPQSVASGLLGYDWEKVVAGRKRCAEDLEEAGLPPAPVNAGSGGAGGNIAQEAEPQEPQAEGVDDAQLANA